MTDDPYVYSGTNVLKNKAGIKSAEALADFEYEQSALRIRALRERPIEGRFDLPHLQEIHRTIFQDVYEWAGEVRTVSISKGASQFAEPPYIEHEAAKLSESLASERHLHGLAKEPFVDRLTHYYAEWNALHPFREGNGRSTRELIGQIARAAGYELDQTRIDNSKGQWNEAARQSFAGRLEPVAAIFRQAVRPTRSVAFETLPDAEALARHPELAGTYEGLARLRSAYAERFPGDTEIQRQYELQARAQVVRTLDTGMVLQARQQEHRARGDSSRER